MILAQFQSLYPAGSLMTELLQIDHGQYIVRATVQIEGVIRSTGMAAAITVEEAEDRARERALMVLGMPSASSSSEDVPVKPVTSTSIQTPAEDEEAIVQEVKTAKSKKAASKTKSKVVDTTSQPAELQTPAPLEIVKETTSNPVEESQPALADIDISATNITPFPQRGTEPPSEPATTKKTTTNKRKKNEPINQSDDIAKISVEMQRLGWTMEQGRDYLIKTYNKRSRHLLSEEELRSFLEYLESQPTPTDMLSDIDPLAGF